MPPVERAAVERSLEYPEESAGRLMQTEFIAVPPFWNVGRTIDYMREEEDLPDEFFMLFVIDAAYHLVGTVALDRLLRSKRPTPISEIMETDVEAVKATDDQEDVARRFERYNLVATPVVDDNGRLVGVITVDDIVDVIEEEAEEDIRRLAGVGDEEASDTVAYVARSRIPWLMVNVVTAFFAAAVIGLFGATDRADGGARDPDADRRLDERQCRYPGDDRHHPRHRHPRYRGQGRAPRDRPRADGGTDQWPRGCRCRGARGGVLVRQRRHRRGDRRGAGRVPARRRAGRRDHPARLRPARHRSGRVASGVIVTAITDATGFFVFLGLAGWWFGLI